MRVSQLTVWIPPKYMSLETNSKQCQLFDTLVAWLENRVDATGARITAAWNGFRKLLPVINNRSILIRNRRNIFSSCIRKTLLYGCETWPVSSETIRCLTSADNGMLHWICGVRLEQRIRTQELHEKVSILVSLKRSDGAGLEWIQVFSQEE